MLLCKSTFSKTSCIACSSILSISSICCTVLTSGGIKIITSPIFLTIRPYFLAVWQIPPAIKRVESKGIFKFLSCISSIPASIPHWRALPTYFIVFIFCICSAITAILGGRFSITSSFSKSSNPATPAAQAKGLPVYECPW